jgi:orotidine-5'-phosphate decarboxylase
MPKTYFLVPGYGAQGGTAEDIVDCFNEDGLGAIINSSRGILFAYQKDEKGYGEENYGEAARIEALNMRNAINHALQINKKGYW